VDKVRVIAVAIDLRGVLALGIKKAERYIEQATRFVGDRAEVPVVTVAMRLRCCCRTATTPPTPATPADRVIECTDALSQAEAWTYDVRRFPTLCRADVLPVHGTNADGRR